MTILTVNDLPTRATLWHDEATILTGNALTNTVDNLQLFNSFSYQNGAANGDSFTQSVFLRMGIYSLTIIGQTSIDEGMVDWYLDGNVILSGQDWYSAAPARNVVKTIANVNVSYDGYHVLKGAINGTNGASVGYALRLTKLAFAQAAD